MNLTMTDPEMFNDQRIIASWRTNAAPWASAVRGHQIESRRLVTDQAIVDAVVSRAPSTVIDIGCGEGWLARTLSQSGIRVLGLDVVPALIEEAQTSGGGEFRVASHEEIAAGAIPVRADLLVCNFSLIGKESVDGLLRAVPGLLTPRGTFVIQTLHPVIACGDQPYRDGWRAGSWQGFDAAFTDPAPWYFRTLGSWVALLAKHRLRVIEMLEPLHPDNQLPASVIFITAPE
jgi:2-polyprenyl-3-methyl-5-hydroxy-6-metoxy-1,4-benzoquinol methylase